MQTTPEKLNKFMHFMAKYATDYHTEATLKHLYEELHSSTSPAVMLRWLSNAKLKNHFDRIEFYESMPPNIINYIIKLTKSLNGLAYWPPVPMHIQIQIKLNQ